MNYFNGIISLRFVIKKNPEDIEYTELAFTKGNMRDRL